MISQATEQLNGQEITRYTPSIEGGGSPQPPMESSRAVPATSLIRYHQSPAEDLSFLEDESVDFVSAGTLLHSTAQVVPASYIDNSTDIHAQWLYLPAQAVHWFNHTKIWKELGRVLRPGGTVAFWVSPSPYQPHRPVCHMSSHPTLSTTH